MLANNIKMGHSVKPEARYEYLAEDEFRQESPGLEQVFVTAASTPSPPPQYRKDMHGRPIFSFPQQRHQQHLSEFGAAEVFNKDWKDITSSSREAYSFSGPDELLSSICEDCSIPLYQCIHGAVSFTLSVS
jgi:hypothetical protein